MKTFLFTAGLLAASTVGAQVSLPGQIIDPVRTVTSPIPDVTERLRERARANRALVTDTIESVPEKLHTVPDTLRLISAQGDVLIEEARDDNAELVLAGEWLLFASDPLNHAFSAPGIKIISSRRLEALSLHVIRIKVSDTLNSEAALNRLLPDGVTAQWVKHHVYLSQAQTLSEPSRSQAPEERCAIPVRVGMVDTAVDASHPMLKHVSVTQQNFHIEGTTTSQAHGTAVAAIAAKRMPQGSEIINASVFYSRSSVSQGATLLSLVEGINYLAASAVKVVNFSLTGPENPLLEAAILQLQQQGVLITAAAGNDGPAAKPRYPAAYEHVIAVTAIDDNDLVYRWANQGDYIELAAPGVSVTTARLDGQTGSETGTSMAAPLVSAVAGCWLAEGNDAAAGRAWLRERASDLGETGRDPVYGHGAIR